MSVEVLRGIAMVLFIVLVIAYPFAVMGPGRPRHTWWAVGMGELWGFAAACAMVARYHDPVTWRFWLFIAGALCGLVFSYFSYRIYGSPGRKRANGR